MSKGKYLKVVGVVEMIAAIILIIAGFVIMVGISTSAAWALNSIGSVDGYGQIVPIVGGTLFLYWLGYLITCFFAPAVGILFFTVADLVDEPRAAAIGHPKISTYNYDKIKRLEDEITQLKNKVEYLSSCVQTDETVELKETQPDPVEVEETIEEQTDTTDEVTTHKNKDDYKLDERIRINSDVEINGQLIKKGSTGVIDNTLITSGGKKYVVIIDETKRTIIIDGSYFE